MVLVFIMVFFISVQCVQNPLTFYAKQLQKAMAGLGTNDTTLIRIIVSRCEIDLGNIKKEYERLHGKTLESVVKVCIVVYTTQGPSTSDVQIGLHWVEEENRLLIACKCERITNRTQQILQYSVQQ